MFKNRTNSECGHHLKFSCLVSACPVLVNTSFTASHMDVRPHPSLPVLLCAINKNVLSYKRALRLSYSRHILRSGILNKNLFSEFHQYRINRENLLWNTPVKIQSIVKVKKKKVQLYLLFVRTNMFYSKKRPLLIFKNHWILRIEYR